MNSWWGRGATDLTIIQTEGPMHNCRLPRRRERRIRGLKRGAVVKCEICGEWWRLFTVKIGVWIPW